MWASSVCVVEKERMPTPCLPQRGPGHLGDAAFGRLRDAFKGRKTFDSRDQSDIIRTLTRNHTPADSRAVGAYLKKQGEKPHTAYPARVRQLLRSVQRARSS